MVAHTAVVAKHTASYCTTLAAKKIAIVAQTVVVVQTTVATVAIPPAVAATVVISALVDVLLPSRNMHPSSSPIANHMCNSPCISAQHIDKTCKSIHWF